VIAAATGHRPPKIGGYSAAAYERLVGFAIHEVGLIDRIDVMITGGALGWDQAVAQACFTLGVDYDMYIPLATQADQWPEEAQERWHALMRGARKVVVTGDPPYTPRLLQIRNERMVDECKVVLALWNGLPAGGTWNCVRYALMSQKLALNVWHDWVEQGGEPA
jgi:uncharacterized phage-like protein YoqJ